MSRSFWTKIEYGAHLSEDTPGALLIDEWSYAAKSLAEPDERLWKNEINLWMSNQRRQPLLSAWLWTTANIPTITPSHLLAETLRLYVHAPIVYSRVKLDERDTTLGRIKEWYGQQLRERPPIEDIKAPDALEILVPDATTLSWDEIFWLRRRPGFLEYVKLLDTIGASPSSAEARRLFNEVQNKSFQLIHELKPRARSTIWEVVLAEAGAALLERFLGLVRRSTSGGL